MGDLFTLAEQQKLLEKEFQGKEVPIQPEWSPIFTGGEGPGDSSPVVTDGEPGKIEFSHNWNKKLDCGSFTSIRLFNPKKYSRGRAYQIFLNRRERGIAELVWLQTIRFADFTPAHAYIDTGYSLEEFCNLLRTMHKNNVPDFRHSLWMFLILKWKERTV